MSKISSWVTASRKKNFTTILIAQNLTELPTTIKRNVNYFVLFKTTVLVFYPIYLGYLVTSKDKMMKISEYATEKPKNFLIIDTKTFNRNEVFRHNFNEFLNPNDF